LYNSSGSFTNAATITIGGTASVGDFGLRNDATFNNNTGGQISIDNTSTDGLSNEAAPSPMLPPSISVLQPVWESMAF
jgi:hypothetical protein